MNEQRLSKRIAGRIREILYVTPITHNKLKSLLMLEGYRANIFHSKKDTHVAVNDT